MFLSPFVHKKEPINNFQIHIFLFIKIPKLKYEWVTGLIVILIIPLLLLLLWALDTEIQK